VAEPEFGLAWFLATPFGKPFDGLDANVYDLALALSEDALAEVRCWCPKLYPQALQIKLSLVLAGMAPTEDGNVLPPAGDAGKVAFVTDDGVGDVARKYTLADKAAQEVASSPAGLLDGIIARCKAPLRTGAFLARSVTRGCGCGPFGIGDKAEFSRG
jgi:hypothetical protein